MHDIMFISLEELKKIKKVLDEEEKEKKKNKDKIPNENKNK